MRGTTGFDYCPETSVIIQQIAAGNDINFASAKPGRATLVEAIVLPVNQIPFYFEELGRRLVGEQGYIIVTRRGSFKLVVAAAEKDIVVEAAVFEDGRISVCGCPMLKALPAISDPVARKVDPQMQQIVISASKEENGSIRSAPVNIRYSVTE